MVYRTQQNILVTLLTMDVDDNSEHEFLTILYILQIICLDTSFYGMGNIFVKIFDSIRTSSIFHL